jgi:hypothetical protein
MFHRLDEGGLNRKAFRSEKHIMSNSNRSYAKWLTAGAALAVLAGFGMQAQGQQQEQKQKPFLDDWSHHRLLFSNPDKLKTGNVKDKAKYSKIVNSARFQHQLGRRGPGGDHSTEGFQPPSKGKKLGGSSSTTHKDWKFTITARGLFQPNMYPAKWASSLSTTAASSSDFVVYPTGVAGGSTSPNILALTNVYKGNPTLSWAYNTNTGTSSSAVTLSPTLSEDGSRILFVQSNAATATSTSGVIASVVILKPETGKGKLNAPASPTAASSVTAFQSCTSCYFSVPLVESDGVTYTNDTYSAPFYDFEGDDAVYVGDDAGYLHKITGVFSGTAIAEASGWPIQLSTINKLTTPVYDATSGNVFVGDTGGVLYAVNASSGTLTASVQLGGTGGAIMDGPIVDSTAGFVYAFVNADSSGQDGVFQLSTTVASGWTYNWEAQVGTGGSEYWLYDGDFDNTYYSSSNATGNLWVVGNTYGSSATPGGILYSVAISKGAMESVTSQVSLTTTYPWASPATEFYNSNNSADYIFFSVYDAASGTGTSNCNSGQGCIFSYDITNASSSTAPTLTGTANVTTPSGSGCWATGGFVIDNDSTSSNASEFYTLELNGNSAGGPVAGAYTSSACYNSGVQTATPIALQDTQDAPG